MAARHYPPPEERFMTKIELAANGCWLWTGEMHRKSGAPTGYGLFHVSRSLAKRRHYAHRWAYEHFIGPIPEGMTIDHVCHGRDKSCSGGPACQHRRCVNPAHLEAVPNGTNVMRGKSPAAEHARQTHCKHGHPFTGANLVITAKGHRTCRECARRRLREVRARQGREAYNAYMRAWRAQRKKN